MVENPNLTTLLRQICRCGCGIITIPVLHLFVPLSTVVMTTDRSLLFEFMKAYEWVDVKRGTSYGNSIEIFGPLQEGDLLVIKATDELRPCLKFGVGCILVKTSVKGAGSGCNNWSKTYDFPLQIRKIWSYCTIFSKENAENWPSLGRKKNE